jgi:DNA-binding MarR family transcriptional regulator
MSRDDSAIPAISRGLVGVLDAVLYLDRKQVVEADGVRLHPSEAHLLACAVEGMGFTAIARHFAISKGAVSQTFGRLAGRGIVTVTKDAARKNAACVQLTPRGEVLLGQVLVLRERLAANLGARLAGYSAAELSTVQRFVDDLEGFVRESLLAAATPSAAPAAPAASGGDAR